MTKQVTASNHAVSPDDPTVVTNSFLSPHQSEAESGSAVRSAPPAVALIEGSAPKLSTETRGLLQSRLCTASLILFVAFVAFLVRHALQTNLATLAGAILFGFHVAATIILGGAWLVLRRRDEISLQWLRFWELTTFGLPAAFFVVVEYFIVLYSCRDGVMDFPEGGWLVLIYTYALFIPNPFRRAAIVIGVLAATPMLLLFGMLWWYPSVWQAATFNQVSGLVVVFALAGVSSIWGVDIIGSLRREAFEARQLGQYTLTRRIGAGGMGEVYLAEHQLLKRPCVVKLIRPDKAGNPKTLVRFQREVHATAKLSHWNTIEIFDYGRTGDGTFYYVMEYLPGMNLGDLVEHYGPLPPERVIYLLRQTCDALNEAHAVGLIHRDIKPANIFAAQRGGVYDVAKLLDFGLVKPLVEEEGTKLTVEGAIAGSPLFMSPEQALGESRPDARSDIYSLGAVAYYLLTGHPPFESDKPLKVMFAHAHEVVTPPSKLRPDLPKDLEAMVMRCLAKDPAARFQTAVGLRDALASCESANRWDRKVAAEWWANHS